MTKKKPAPKNKGGRPTKITKEFLDQLETLLIGGVHPRTAVMALGISGESCRAWRERGRAHDSGTYPETPFGRFAALVDRSHALSLAGVDRSVSRAASAGDMGAARLFYQRVRAENFEPRNLKDGLALTTDVDDDNDALLTSLATRVAGLVKAGAAGAVPSGA